MILFSEDELNLSFLCTKITEEPLALAVFTQWFQLLYYHCLSHVALEYAEHGISYFVCVKLYKLNFDKLLVMVFSYY